MWNQGPGNAYSVVVTDENWKQDKFRTVFQGNNFTLDFLNAGEQYVHEFTVVPVKTILAHRVKPAKMVFVDGVEGESTITHHSNSWPEIRVMDPEDSLADYLLMFGRCGPPPPPRHRQYIQRPPAPPPSSQRVVTAPSGARSPLSRPRRWQADHLQHDQDQEGVGMGGRHRRALRRHADVLHRLGHHAEEAPHQGARGRQEDVGLAEHRQAPFVPRERCYGPALEREQGGGTLCGVPRIRAIRLIH